MISLITYNGAIRKLGKIDGRMSKYLVNFYMHGYNDAVKYANSLNSKPEKKCGYCGTMNLRKNETCIRCGIDFYC
jgi:hypothetical protein